MQLFYGEFSYEEGKTPKVNRPLKISYTRLYWTQLMKNYIWQDYTKTLPGIILMMMKKTKSENMKYNFFKEYPGTHSF